MGEKGEKIMINKGRDLTACKNAPFINMLTSSKQCTIHGVTLIITS